MKGRDARIDSGFIGCCGDANEMKLTLSLFEQCGLKVWRKRGDRGTLSLWTKPENTLRAREIRRGFKTGLKIRGDVYDLLVGIRAALNINQKSMYNCPVLPMPRKELQS